MTANRVRFDKLRAIAGTGAAGPGVIPATYTSDGAMGFYVSQTVPAPFTHQMRVLNFQNDTNGFLAISFDGINDNGVVPPNSFTLYDLTAQQDHDERFRYQIGTQIYIKYLLAPTVQLNSTNTLYLTCVYGLGE